MKYVILAEFSSPATQTSAKSLSENRFSLFLLHEHLANQFKVSFADFVYAQTHNRAATQLMSIKLGAGTYLHGRDHSFCLVLSKPNQNYLQLQTTKIVRAIKSVFQISVWPRIGKYAVCRVSLMKQRAHEISTGSAPRWDAKI